MADTTDICDRVNGCCGVLPEQEALTLMARLLCCIAENTSPATPPVVDNCSVTSYCDETTNTWWCKKVCVMSDGTILPDELIDTGVSCDDQEPTADSEFVCNAVTGFYDEIFTLYDETGAEISRTITPTAIICQQDDIDIQLVCASTDKRYLKLEVNQTTGVTTLTELDGTPITDGATAVNCDKEFKYIEKCFQDTTDPAIQYSLLICLDAETLLEEARIWFDSTGAPLGNTQPANSEPCTAPDKCHTEVIFDCLCDDVDGDLSNVVNYVQAHIIEIVNGAVQSSTNLGTFTDKTLSTTYLPVNPVDCNEVAQPAMICQRTAYLDGSGSWAVTATVTSYNITVHSANGGTWTDTSGFTRPLVQGEFFSHCQESGAALQPGARVDAVAGDLIVVTYNEYCV